MSPPLQPEILLSHAGALRSMARALLGDEHAADDVLQDTWLRALIAPPSVDDERTGVGGWLRSVAHGFALQHRRGEVRRTRREQVYAAERPEALDADQRSAVLRAVMEAVLALDEPYRETVLLRWFEGLPPRAIAARLGVAVATIDSRLQRAHARLRARLERDLGREPRGWRGLVALALGAPDRAVASTLVLPLIGVAVSLKVVGAALAAVVGICVWVGWDREQPADVAPAHVAIAAEPATEPSPLAAEPLDDARALATSAEPAPTSPESKPGEGASELAAGPYSFALEVDVVDSAERPIHGAQVRFGPAAYSAVAIGETGWDGRLVVEWRGFAPTFDGVLSVRVDGRETALRRVALTAGARYAARFETDPAGFSLALTGVVEARTKEMRLEAVRFTVATPLGDRFALDAAGNGVFDDSSLVFVRPPEESGERAHTRNELKEKLVAGSRISSEFALSVDLATLRADALAAGHEPARATVRGVVQDENGRPIHDLVVGGRTPDKWNTGVVCDADGAFVFRDVPPGPFELHVGGGQRVALRTRIELAPGESRFVVLQPLPRPTVRVKLADANSAPLAQWRVEARGAGVDAPLLGVATTDEHGAAVIGLLGGGALQIYARPDDRGGSPAVLVGQCTSAQTDELALQLPHEARAGSITLQVGAPPGATPAARAWRVDGGDGVALHGASSPSPELSGLTTGGVQPGRWRVEVRVPGGSWSDVGEFELLAGQKLDLGRVMLPVGASVAIAPAETEPPQALTVRTRSGGAVVVWPERDVALPATLDAPADVELDVLHRASGATEQPKRSAGDALRTRAGREHALELRRR